MENPRTWSHLHKAVNNALYTQKEGSPATRVVEVLRAEGLDATEEAVTQTINRWTEHFNKGMCGPSLTAMIVAKFQR